MIYTTVDIIFVLRKIEIVFPSKLAIWLNYESNKLPHCCSVSIFGFIVIRWLNHITQGRCLYLVFLVSIMLTKPEHCYGLSG